MPRYVPRTVVVLIALAAFMSAITTTAQYYPTLSARSWNSYVASVVPHNFTSIIGAGGTMFPNSNLQAQNSSQERCFTYSMPFAFTFLAPGTTQGITTYPQGQTILVSTNGYISFANTNYGSTNGTLTGYSYYGYYQYFRNAGPSHSKLIAPFMGWLAGAGVPNSGVYHMVQGTAPNRTLVFEWRMRYGYTGGGNDGSMGNFQARLSEATGNIEFQYSEEPINILYYFYAVTVGLKNLGEPYPDYTAPTTTSRGTPEWQRYFQFNNPFAGEGDTIAITAQEFDWYGSYGYVRYYPRVYTNPINPRANPYAFHFSFPADATGERIGYKLSPVINDVSAANVTFQPTAPAFAYAPGQDVTVITTFTNQGANDRQNIPVVADVYRNGVKQSSITGTAFPTATPQFGTHTYTFPTQIGNGTRFTDTTGVYQVRVYAQLSSDQDASNDTARGTFYISRDYDAMPYEIMQPLSNELPLNQKYPVGVGVPLEVRYMNIGLLAQRDTKVGIIVTDASGVVVHKDSTVLAGLWAPISFRDWTYANWTPSTPGRYFVRAFTALAGDQQPLNDTLPQPPNQGKPFDVRYEIEISAIDPLPGGNLPPSDGLHAIGRPLTVLASFGNSGVSDATNVPVRVRIVGPGGTVVYDRTSTILSITADNGRTAQTFPEFTPLQAGTYCMVAFSEYAGEPIRSNDTARWCFTVKPALTGTIRIGFGERFRSIKEARDSMFFYGVSGPVTFELTDDSYTVETSDKTLPALDLRGRVIGLSATNPVIWRPVVGKTMVTVNLKSASGIGMWFGQMDTSNPSGYMTFDGTTRKALTFTYENTQATPSEPAFQRSLPFFFGQGSSNYAIVNSTITPFNTASGKKTFLSIPMVRYLQSFNEFQYPQDLVMAVSAGIMSRNSAPIDPVIGRNWNNRDTLRNQNNRFENNEIRNFGYGILSVGAGPLFVVGTGRYVEYPNQNNIYRNNLIEDVTRGGVVVAYEKGSEITGNRIRRVSNNTTTPNAAGISATAGGNALNNRAYSSDLKIEKNLIHQVNANTGNTAAISLETAENLFITPANIVYRFPASGATNHRVWNNSAYTLEARAGQVYGVAMYPEATTRIDFVSNGNQVENNTFYNAIGSQAAEATLTPSNADHIGVLALRAGGMVRNNIINLEDNNSIGLVITLPNYKTSITSDYNAFDIPNGSIGALANVSPQGFVLPSPQMARTLNQWRALTGLDMNSVSGDVTREFVSTTPGAENLHIQPNLLGSIVGNRGAVVTGMTTDIDNDPRGASSVAGRYDIGSDEFTGQVRNFDIMAEDVIAPVGYRASTGQYSDAEYVMTDSAVALKTMVRNVGGQPMTNRTVTMSVSYINPSNGSVSPVTTQTRTNVAVDVAQATTTDFGTWQPRTLRELGLSDSYYGTSPNVTPVYRFTVTSGTDDNMTNNTYSKDVRFYVQRSGREAMLSVENYNGWSGMSTAAQISNKLNTDTLIAALARINWERADGVNREDYDLFERDKWPSENVNFTPWSTMLWEQGSEATGLAPAERSALKAMLNMGSSNFRTTLVMAGQDVARLHDVALTSSNGAIADQDFVENYLRSDYRGNTNPADYSNRTIQGIVITPGRFEELEPTRYIGDATPRPAVLRATGGEGVARASHKYTMQNAPFADSLAGIASNTGGRNVVYYAFDWRHAGRFDFEADRSGAWRLLLGALDFSAQFRGVLPVDFKSFTAYQSSDRAVNIDWTTTMETEIASMSIERATVRSGETGSFELVERVGSRGTAASGADYRVIDRGVEPGGEYVYRLVSTATDGERLVERQQTVKLTSATTGGMKLSVAPNPVRARATVTLAGVSESSTVELYDDAGRLVRDLGTVSATGTLVLDATDLSNGSYTIRVRTSAGTQIVERVTVTR